MRILCIHSFLLPCHFLVPFVLLGIVSAKSRNLASPNRSIVFLLAAHHYRTIPFPPSPSMRRTPAQGLRRTAVHVSSSSLSCSFWLLANSWRQSSGNSSTSSSTMVRFSDEKEIPTSVMRFFESAYFPAYSLPFICSIASAAGRSSLNSMM